MSIKISPSIFLILAFIGALIGLYFFVPPPGYCNVQNRYLSDEELKRLVVSNSLQAMRTSDEADSPEKKINGSVDFVNEYIKNNSNCCVIYRNYSNFLERLLGINEIEIYWYFKRQQAVIDKDGDGPEYKYYEQHDLIDSCGVKVLRSWGSTKKDLVLFNLEYNYQNSSRREQ
jgi:hypothetical protein